MVIGSCSLGGKPVVISTVQPELRIDLANPLNTSSNFAFRLTTLEETCTTSDLIVGGLLEGNQVRIDVTGLVVPATCLTDLDFIRSDVGLEVTPAFYDFDISVGEGLNSTGFFSFDGNTYNLELEDAAGIEVGHDELHRIPEYIVWGTMSGGTNPYDIFEDFLSVIQPMTDPLLLQEGYYGHFSVEPGSSFNVVDQITESNAFSYPYVIRLKEDVQSLKQTLEEFRLQYSGSIDITATTWDGRIL